MWRRDLAQARQICKELDENESVATRDGVWMNNYWISIDRPGEETAGMLSREQELSRLKQQQVEAGGGHQSPGRFRGGEERAD